MLGRPAGVFSLRRGVKRSLFPSECGTSPPPRNCIYLLPLEPADGLEGTFALAICWSRTAVRGAVVPPRHEAPICSPNGSHPDAHDLGGWFLHRPPPPRRKRRITGHREPFHPGPASRYRSSPGPSIRRWPRQYLPAVTASLPTSHQRIDKLDRQMGLHEPAESAAGSCTRL
jgi:hypothetical protein